MQTIHRLERIIAGMLFCLLSITAYGQTGREATDSLLMQRGMRLTEKMRQLATIPQYLNLALSDSATIRITRELVQQTSGTPCRIFAIGNLETAISPVLLMYEFFEENIPKEIRGDVIRRILEGLPSLINKELDAGLVAMLAVLSTEDVFRCEGLHTPILHLYLYKGTCHSMVLFLPYADNIVKATALLVSNPKFDGVRTAEDIQKAFAEMLFMDSVQSREINVNTN